VNMVMSFLIKPAERKIGYKVLVAVRECESPDINVSIRLFHELDYYDHLLKNCSALFHLLVIVSRLSSLRTARCSVLRNNVI
jgi:hypothetical protein